MMKTFISILLLITLTACDKPGARQVAPTKEGQATIRARELANKQARALYQCEPFAAGPAALWTNGHWVWQDRRGLGSGDIEAVVSLAPDLSTQSVQVLLLDSRTKLPMVVPR